MSLPQSTSPSPTIAIPGQARRPVVLQVLPALVAGGAERGCVDVAAALVRAGGLALVASAGGPMARELARAGADHVVLPLASKSPVVMHRNAGRLAALIERRGVDIVHARSRAPAWSAWLACRRTGAPLVTTVHAPYNAGHRAKRFYNGVMARGDRVIAISGYVARHVAEQYGVGPDRLRTIPRGVDPTRFAIACVAPDRMVALARQWRLPEDRPIVLMPGRLTRWKGQTVLLDALTRLGRRDLYCVIVGHAQGRDAYRQELIDRIGRLGLGGVAQIVDHCDDMPAAYMLSDVVVHASTDPEGFGRVVVEAQALGRPVIATDIGAPPELIVEGETGWLVPPGDPERLAAALARALDLAPECRSAMAERAVAAVAARYTVQAMTDATLAVYGELLAERGRG